MLNPDRGELRLQQTSAPETPKKNGHLPRWLRTPAFTARTCLALLTATPAMVIAADAFTRTENSSIVYGSGQNVTINPQYSFDQLQLATPIPTEIPQPPAVYKVRLFMDMYDVPSGDKEIRFISPHILYGHNTGIPLKIGQNVEISATGRTFINGPWSISTFRDSGCHDVVMIQMKSIQMETVIGKIQYALRL